MTDEPRDNPHRSADLTLPDAPLLLRTPDGMPVVTELPVAMAAVEPDDFINFGASGSG